jgi:hypothetical protein
VVRRIPDLNADKNKAAGQEALFDIWRFHAFFTTVDAEVMDTVTADKTHRGHAIIEQVNADLKNSALAHLPSGVFTANAAWLVLAVMAFNLTRAAATLTGGNLAKAVTGTVRRKLVNVAARIASSARRITLHCPATGPGRHHGPACSLMSAGHLPPPCPDHHAEHRPDRRPRSGTPPQRGGTPNHAPNSPASPSIQISDSHQPDRWIEAKSACRRVVLGS